MRNNTYFLKKKSLYFVLLGMFLLWQNTAHAVQSYRFGVTNVETVMTTAAQWNPVLAWIEKRTGIALTLQMGMRAEETQARLMRGEYDFFLGYPFLQDGPRQQLGFHVLLKAKDVINSSAIVVQDRTSIRTLADLNGQELWIPHENAFIAHTVPMAMLLEKGVRVRLQSVANQESLVTAFKLGKVQAAALNMGMFKRAMANKEDAYRVLWHSPPLPSLPIGVQQSVPLGVAERVQAAFVDMVNDAEGKQILESLNRRMGLKLSGWELATDAEYQFAIDSYQQVAQDKIERHD